MKRWETLANALQQMLINLRKFLNIFQVLLYYAFMGLDTGGNNIEAAAGDFQIIQF